MTASSKARRMGIATDDKVSLAGAASSPGGPETASQ
jgi:hypothetical protein